MLQYLPIKMHIFPLWPSLTHAVQSSLYEAVTTLHFTFNWSFNALWLKALKGFSTQSQQTSQIQNESKHIDRYHKFFKQVKRLNMLSTYRWKWKTSIPWSDFNGKTGRLDKAALDVKLWEIGPWTPKQITNGLSLSLQLAWLLHRFHYSLQNIFKRQDMKTWLHFLM